MSNTLHAAFVLHRRPFSDSSLLLETLTPEYGRQPVLAKGARRRSGFGQLQPFVPLWISWRGRGEVKTLTTVDVRGSAFSLAEKRLYCAMYLTELTARMTPRGDSCEGLFGAYERSLTALSDGGEIEPLLRGFELDMLDELGYGLMLTHTSEDEAVEADTRYEYGPDVGPSRARAFVGSTVHGKTLLAMARRDFSDPGVRRESLLLMRRILDFHLGYTALKSRELFARNR